MLKYVLIAMVIAGPAEAADITDKTPCSAVVAAYDSENVDRVRPFDQYIHNTLENIDYQHQPMILNRMSRDGRIDTDVMVVEICRTNQKHSIHQAAILVYDGIIRLGITIGAYK
jgi:hypothetical protein